MNGAGAPPLKAQALYVTPGAISIVLSTRTSLTRATGPAGAGGSAASIAVCFFASTSALVGP
jgi:hypothetical protein